MQRRSGGEASWSARRRVAVIAGASIGLWLVVAAGAFLLARAVG